MISLFKTLIPAWRFFDEIHEVPKLYYRTRAHLKPYTPWRPVEFKAKRRPWNLLFNPRDNIYLAYISMLDRFMHELRESEDHPSEPLMESVSYNLILAWVKREITVVHNDHESIHFQFKIEVTPLHGHEQAYDALISLEHEV